MRNKPADKLYCGVDIKKIKSAHPVINETNFKYLINFINRRYSIHYLKDVFKRPAPWTKDKILQEYRFTNVRREHDRETIWLIKHIAKNPSLTYRDKLLNIILFRLYNKSETMEIVGPIARIARTSFDPEIYRQKFYKFEQKNPKYTFFTSAFYTTGMRMSVRKITDEEYDPIGMLKYVNYLKQVNVLEDIESAVNQKEVFEAIIGHKGIGPFLGYQIFVDFTYIDEFPFSENEFTIAGPGCRKGLQDTFDDPDGLNYEEQLFWLRDNIDKLCEERKLKWDLNKLMKDLPEEDRVMNVMSLENCHCEISKYIRAKTGEGRPKNKYKPTKKPMEEI